MASVHGLEHVQRLTAAALADDDAIGPHAQSVAHELANGDCALALDVGRARLETMVLFAGVELPLRAVREQIASAVDLIVHQERLKDGTRKITNITEVQGMEGDVIVLQDVFIFEQTGLVEGKVQGRLRPTGVRPRFAEKFEAHGIHLPPRMFGNPI